MALATAHAPSAGVDMQPLDLSIRPRREKHWPLQFDVLKPDQADVTTACKFDMTSAGSERLSPCNDPPDSYTRHQHAGLLSSLLSNTDLTFYTRRHRSSSTCGFRGNHQRKSPYYLPPRHRNEMCQEDSFVQQLSGGTDEDVCSSRDFATSCCQNPGCDVYSQIHTSFSPHDPADLHPSVKPHPFTTNSLAATSSVCQSANSPMYSQGNTTQIDYPCHGNSDDIRQFSCDPYNPIQQHYASRDTIFDHLGANSATGYEESKSFREHAHKMCPASYFRGSPQTPHENWQEQLSAPDSPDLVSSSMPCPWEMYSDNISPPFSKPSGILQHNSCLLEQPGMYTHLEMRNQHLPCYTKAPRLKKPARSHLSSKDNTPWKQRPGHKPTSLTPTDCDQVSTSTDVADITDNRHKTLKYLSEANLRHRSSRDNVNSTQVNILDFLISQFLSEPSVETTSREKPCHVEYICSEGGQKKIRFRLVDLMELQVEQSLMA